MPKTGEVAVGVIAQEVEKTNLDSVKTRMIKMILGDRQDSEINVVDYSKFSYMLINAVKELYAKWLDQHNDLQNLKTVVENKDQEIQTLKSDNQRIKQYLCQKDLQSALCR